MNFRILKSLNKIEKNKYNRRKLKKFNIRKGRIKLKIINQIKKR